MNQPLLNALHPDEVDVVIQRVEEAEVDEMWSYVGKKREPRWLWHAIDHHTGKVLAYVFGRRQDQVFLQLKGLLEAGLVEARAENRNRYYRAKREALGPMAEMLERMWDDALWKLKLAAELEQSRRGPKSQHPKNSKKTKRK